MHFSTCILLVPVGLQDLQNRCNIITKLIIMYSVASYDQISGVYSYRSSKHNQLTKTNKIIITVVIPLIVMDWLIELDDRRKSLPSAGADPEF